MTEEPQCGSNISDTAAALCDPISGTVGSGSLTIDAAILALNHSFAVNNYDNGNNSASGPEGKLVIYGAIAQDWRGAVGTFSGSSISTGYSKYYTWDNRLQYVSIPAYLNPGTPSWSLASSATVPPSLCAGGTPTLPAAYSGPNPNYPNSSGTTCSSQP